MGKTQLSDALTFSKTPNFFAVDHKTEGLPVQPSAKV